MPYLARSQENRPSILALYAVDADGILYDPETVEFRVIDSTGDNVFPAGPGTYEDVTEDGRVDTGIWYAYDTDEEAGWTPDSMLDIGTYTIEWRYTSPDGETVRTWALQFDVYEEGTGLPYWTYLTPNMVRNEGIDTSDISDAKLVELIADSQAYIERACRQPFRPIADTLKLDGNGSPTLFFSVPIVGVSSLKVNNSQNPLDTGSYRVYAMPADRSDPGWLPKDHRRNPKIALTTGDFGPYSGGGIFSSGRLSGATFAVAPRAHEVKGVFGFLEPDGTTPTKIRRAMLLLVLANAEPLEVGSQNGLSPAAPIVRERTDRHEVEYARPGAGTVGSSMLATTREVEEIIVFYKAPIGLGAPPTTWQTFKLGTL